MAKQEELCGCGEGLRYRHMVDGKEVMSCNKHIVCLTHSEQFQTITRIGKEMLRYKSALEKIVNSDANREAYEHMTWAKEALKDG